MADSAEPADKPYLYDAFITSSSDLNDQIREALIGSRYLMVVCSAFTPRSKWVEREIEIFNELGRRSGPGAADRGRASRLVSRRDA